MLSLRGASYRYPGAKRDTLHGVDLDLLDVHLLQLVGALGALHAVMLPPGDGAQVG